MTAEQVRRIKGGVIGGFTPVQARVVADEIPEGLEVGEHKLGIKVPAGHFIYGVSLRNVKDDLVGAGAVLGVKIGMVAELQDVAIDTIKGVGIAKIVEEPLCLEEDAELLLEVADAPIEKGTLDIGLIYG